MNQAYRHVQEAVQAAELLREIGPVETVRHAVTLFELVGMLARNLSARTRKEYSNDLAALAVFLEERGISQLKQVALPHLEPYQADLDHRGQKPSTRNRKTHSIRTYFSFLDGHGILRANPALKLIPPRANKKEPRYLSEEEYRRLLRACGHNPRDAAIIEVFLQTGMRLSELANLTFEDLELPTRITRDPDNTEGATIRRKGGKLVTIPLNYKACQALSS